MLITPLTLRVAAMPLFRYAFARYALPLIRRRHMPPYADAGTVATWLRLLMPRCFSPAAITPRHRHVAMILPLRHFDAAIDRCRHFDRYAMLFDAVRRYCLLIIFLHIAIFRFFRCLPPPPRHADAAAAAVAFFAMMFFSLIFDATLSMMLAMLFAIARLIAADVFRAITFRAY